MNAPRKGMRSFLTIWVGQTVSLLGSGITGFALSVWIFSQTGNATPIALTALSQWLPRIVLAPVAGIVADRYRRKLVMIAADSFAAIVTAVAAFLVIGGGLEIWHIYILAAMHGIAGSFQQPAMTASITMLVDKENLSRAAGMQQVSHAIEAIATPMIAGILMPVIGLFGVIIVDLATFLVGAGTLIATHIPQPKQRDERAEGQREKGLRAAVYGLKFIAGRPGLLAMMIYFALVNFSANFAAIVIPPLVLSLSNATGLGLVQMISGAGMLTGGIVASIWGGPKEKMRLVFVAIAITGVGLLFSGLIPAIWSIAAGMFIMVVPIPLANGPAQAIWQTKVEPSVQGQVFAARGMISTAMMPLAFGLAGPLADRVFEPMMSGAAPPALLAAIVGTGAGRGYGAMLAISGVALVVATALFALYRPLRRVEHDIPDVVIEEERDETADQPAEAATVTLATE